ECAAGSGSCRAGETATMICTASSNELSPGDPRMKGNSGIRLKAFLASAMLALAVGAPAQAPSNSRDKGDPSRSPLALGGRLDRATTIQSFGLNEAALSLTSVQVSEINKAADAYAAEMNAIYQKYPVVPGSAA